MLNIERMNLFFRKAGETILRFRWIAIILFLLVILGGRPSDLGHAPDEAFSGWLEGR